MWIEVSSWEIRAGRVWVRVNRDMDGEVIPQESAMFSAVSSLSPVIIQIFMSISRNFLMVVATFGCSLSSIAVQPRSRMSVSTREASFCRFSDLLGFSKISL